jgi:hypothetical protein
MHAEASARLAGCRPKPGSLRVFPAPRQYKLALMNAAVERGLVVWNKMLDKYELLGFGHKRLKEYRHKIATEV